MNDHVPMEVLGEEDLLQTWHFIARRLTVRFDGQDLVRDIEVHRGSAAAVAFDEEDRVALVRQFRIPIRRWTLELPTGGREEHETAESTIRRELVEEVGLLPDTLEPLIRFANAPGHSTQWTDVFLARSCRTVSRATAGPEEALSSVVRMPLAAAVELVERGEILDAKSMLGLLAAARRLS